MIERKQLAEAIGRLDPRSREVLDYSLRRHVPDADLAAVFACEPKDVARMRAAAVEQLSEDLGVQRGADLGHVLTGLLDKDTWELLPPSTALESPEVPTPAAESPTPATEPLAPPEEPAPAPAAKAESSPEPPARVQRREEAGESELDEGEERPPVLGMLAPSAKEEAPPSGSDARGKGPSPAQPSRPMQWQLVASLAVALLMATGLAGVLLMGDKAGGSGPSEEDSAARPFVPERQAIGDPFPTDPESVNHYPIAILGGSSVLYEEPGGEPSVRIGGKTDWGSPRVLSVVERRGDWLAVLVPELDNGEVGWIRDDKVKRLSTVSWAIRADLAKREVIVERDGEVIKRMSIGIGRADHPTPTGQFAVTDKLKVTDEGSPYGCCVLALTGHQTKLPEGWPGGDRLAIHATRDLSGLGQPVSLGCMRAHPDNVRWLMNAVPLGTPVFIEEGGPARREISRGGRKRRS
jgi:hypothetical protein